MRTLKYAILGLLNRGPLTGYDLGKEFDFQLAEFWTAKTSQIYPELKKLVTEGLIKYDIEISGEVLEKKLYHITENGKKEFLEWLDQDVPAEKTPKNLFRLRMYFSYNLDINTRKTLLESQLKQHNERLEFLYSQIARYPELPPLNSADFGDFMVLDGAIMREKINIEWLTKYINICKDKN